jgi:hypothetical protein
MNERSQSHIVIEQLEKLSGYQSFVESVLGMNLDDASLEKVAILENATNLLVAVHNFLRISLIYLQTNFFIHIGEAIIGTNAIFECKKELDDAVKEFDLSVSRGAHLVTLKIQQEKENEKILHSLSDMDFNKKQIDIRDKRLPGTGQWIFKDEKFEEWWNGDTSMLWCPGMGMFRFAESRVGHD